MIFGLLIVLLIVLFVLLSFVWPPESPWAPQWRISRSNARKALSFIKISKKDIVYELGCGDGEFVLTVAEDFGATSVGIEIDPFRYCVSWLRARLSNSSRKISIMRKDFKQVKLSNATVIYMYLIPMGMKKILPQLKRELNSGTKIVSYRYKIPLSSKEKKIKFLKEEPKEKFFLYIVT